MAGASDFVYRRVEDPVYRSAVRSFAPCDMGSGPWVAGGSVRKAWHGLDWRSQDVDFFFGSQKDFDWFDQRLRAKFDMDTPSRWYDALLSKTTVTCFETANAKTYSIDGSWLPENNPDREIYGRPLKVQAIRKQYPTSIEELFDSFDFTVCQFATDGNIMVATRSAIEDCQQGVLRHSNPSGKKPTKTRVVKYAAYGFKPTDDMMAEVLKAMSNNETLEMPDDY